MPSRPDRFVRLTAGKVEVVVDLDEGARAATWSVGGLSLLNDYGPKAEEHGMYPMAPWAGRVRGNRVSWDGRDHDLPATFGPWAIHGTVLRQPAVVVHHEQDAEGARLVARVEDHPGWPWPAAVDIGWEVQPGAVTTTITVHALTDPFPTVVGWHPWFRRRLDEGDPLLWTLEATGRMERGEDYLPTGGILPFDASDGPFDDAFIVPSGRAVVRWPGALEIVIANDADWYVVFDQLASSVCIEPQSGPPDGLSGSYGRPAPIAAPGSPHTLVTTWTIRDDRPGDRG